MKALLVLALLMCSVINIYGQSGMKEKTSFINVSGARLYVRTVGSADPLVIIHGGPGLSHDYLAPQMIDLLAKDFQLVFYDQRASGKSTGVEDTSRLTMAQFVDDIEALRKALKIEKLNLLGHSFGGLLAMYYAFTYPDQVGKLLLLDTSPASWELNFPYFRNAIATRQTDDDKRQLADMKKNSGFGKDPALMDRYYKVFFRTFFKDPDQSQQLSMGIDVNWLANSSVTGDRIWNDLGHYDVHDQLPKITSQTMIVHGDASVITVEGAEAIAKKVPNSKLIVLKDVGHFPYIEAPQEFRSIARDFFSRKK